MSEERLFVPQDEAARMLGITVREVYELRRSRQLVARKYGRKVLIPVAELRRYADSLPVEVV